MRDNFSNFMLRNRVAMISIGLFCLTVFILPAIVDAQGFSRLTIPAKCNEAGKECGWNELVALGSEILQFAIYLAVLGATVAFIWAGFKMMMNQGNSGEVEKAKKIIYTAIWGLVITMAAWLIVDFILDNLGVQSEFRSLVK